MKINKSFILVFKIFIFFAIYSSHTFSQGFLRVDGKKIINDWDSNFILKGMGLGGWLVQEGYMLKTGKLDAENQIRTGIIDLIGEEKTTELYRIYLKNYVRKIDIDSLAAWGFNSIRLPMHYNKLMTPPFFEFNEEGFKTIDTLLTWCEENKMYLILDLHAAPGGQSAGGIADYNPNYPSLWESEVNKNFSVDLWRSLAERYAGKEWIGGFDLINEPAWDLGKDAPALRELYIRITKAIREVDKNHILFIEGNWWATNFDGLTPPWDDNMVYSFHKYWNETDQGTIQYLIKIRDTYNRPLWLGETGENSNDWFREVVKLMKDNNIGWAWWPHKKIDNISGPLSSPIVDGYQQIIDYWNGVGAKPSESFAYNVLLNQFQNLKFENCLINRDVYKSLLEPKPSLSIPFKNNIVPGTIYGSDYDLGGQLVGYFDQNYKNTGSGSYNNGWSYRNDGVDIEKCTDNKTNGFNIGWIETGEWLNFTLNISDSGLYDFNFRFAATSANGKFLVDLNGNNIISFTDIPNTGGWQNWQTISKKGIYLPKGIHKIQLRFFFEGYNFNYIEITPTITDNNEKFNLLKKYELFQNFPNPFNPSTKINFSVPELSEVNLTLFNSIGEKLKTILDTTIDKGNQSLTFDGTNLTSGIYYCKMFAKSLISEKEFQSAIKLVFLK